MKTKLLLLCLFTTMLTLAQSSIDTFYPPTSTYELVSSSTPIDQTPSGANATWTFDNLTNVGYTSDDYPTPSGSELSTYPGTTTVTRTTATVELSFTETRVFSKNISNEVSITGVKNDVVDLNFATNNATLGTFPLNYGYLYTDDLAGTYNYDTYSGTFTGTVTTSVDAYGILNSTVDGIAINNQAVTRLKSVQNISLNYSFLTNVGTIVQTIYSYYVAGNSAPVFRASTTAVNVPLLSIDQTSEQLERELVFIGVGENVANSNVIKTFPNPTHDVLNIDNRSMENIKSISITDMSGRIVLRDQGNVNSVSLAHLQNGMYMVTIETNRNRFTQKIVKN